MVASLSLSISVQCDDSKYISTDQALICLRNLRQTMKLGGRKVLPDGMKFVVVVFIIGD